MRKLNHLVIINNVDNDINNADDGNSYDDNSSILSLFIFNITFLLYFFNDNDDDDDVDIGFITNDDTIEINNIKTININIFFIFYINIYQYM